MLDFGNDRNERGIYKAEDGSVYYLGVQEWVFKSIGNRNYLTTEDLAVEILRDIYARMTLDRSNIRFLHHSSINPSDALFPINVPVKIDRRAGKKNLDALIKELLDENPDAYIICNGAEAHDRVLTYQAAKGRNDLFDRDIYIVVTYLAPEQYMELNVIGQWLNIPNIFKMFYVDQIVQAVGRNKGFRDDGMKRKAVVIASPSLAYSEIIREGEGNNGSERSKGRCVRFRLPTK